MPERAERPFLRDRLRYDAEFALEARFAAEQGIPWREYLLRWSREDRNLVIAVMLEKGQECSGCGTSAWQWEENPLAFVAVQHICPGCAAKDRLRTDEDDAPKMPGSSIKLVTRDTAERLAETVRKRPRSLRERAQQT